MFNGGFSTKASMATKLWILDQFNVGGLITPLIDTYLKTRGIDLTDSLKLKFGGISNFTEIDKSDGSLRYRGDATVWKDMIADLFGKRLSSVVGTVDYNYEDNCIDFASGGAIATANDRVGGNLEINHEMKVGSSITFKPHIHWFQDAATAYEMTVRYRVQNNGEAKTTAWTTKTLTAGGAADVFTYVSGVLNQITRFPDITIDCGISDTIQFQMARTDALGGTMAVFFMDMHGEVDSGGSNEEIIKEA